MPRGLRQVALSISCLSPIVRRPDAFAVTKIASLILRPERRFLALTSFQSLTRPSLSFGSSSLISLRRQSLSLSRARLRPPGNIQRPSCFRLTSSTRPRFAATSFEDFAIPKKHHLSTHPDDFNGPLSESSIRSKTQRRPPQLAASFSPALASCSSEWNKLCAGPYVLFCTFRAGTNPRTAA